MVEPLPDVVRQAIICGWVPEGFRDLQEQWDEDPYSLTVGEKVILFAETYMIVPDGILEGQPLVLDEYQKAFFLSLFDGPTPARRAVLSIGRRNGKTFVVAILALAYLCGPLAGRNEIICSAALSREQAAITFRFMRLLIDTSPELTAKLHYIPSSKVVQCPANGSEFRALSADAGRGFGRGIRLVILDEAGQIRGPYNDFISMLETSQGSVIAPMHVTVSTQAASDADYLSIQIDHAVRHQPKNAVVHLYASPEGCHLLDRSAWMASNPGLGKHRSEEELSDEMARAIQLPSIENSRRNLYLNQRTALEGIWLAATPWKHCSGPVDIELFRDGQRPVAAGLDLSQRNDLTALVLSVMSDEGEVHQLTVPFCPLEGIEARSLRDRAPYNDWVRDGFMVPLGGHSVDYEQVCEYLAPWLDEHRIAVTSVHFDRYWMKVFRPHAETAGLFGQAEWFEVGQGFVGFTAPMTDYETLVLEGRIRHGNHPVLTLGASHAIAVMDPTGSKKLDKSKSTQRIDALVAAVMSAHGVSEGVKDEGPSVYEQADLRYAI